MNTLNIILIMWVLVNGRIQILRSLFLLYLKVQTEVLEREHVELRRQLEGTIESLETEFVMAAISELDKRMELLLEKINRGQGYGAVGPAEAKPADCDGDGANGTTDNSKIKDVKRVRVKRRGKSADKIPRVGAGLNLSINWDEYSCFYQGKLLRYSLSFPVRNSSADYLESS